jgi:HSP20 family protein
MNIVTWKPFAELDRFFDDRASLALPRFGGDLAVDLYEENGNVIAKMNLPGVKPDELDITLENDTLVITGRREEEKKTEEKDYYHKEIRRGSFSRSVSLPKSVNAEATEARYDGGVLVVTMPIVKGAEEKATKIPLHA